MAKKSSTVASSPERERLLQNAEKTVPLERWGPYLSERQWGTVREDYSASGDAWGFFPHDQARSRVYRWGEDGLLGISDRRQHVCFGLALWNHNDSILKERLFGLSNREGNHGEDVKELYYYLDNTPTHSYMKSLYKYPQAAYPYSQLVYTNAARTRQEPEFEILHTGVFDDGHYFDVLAEYAKQSSEDLCIRITITNRSDREAELTLLPTLWCRNRWTFEKKFEKPTIHRRPDTPTAGVAFLKHPRVGDYHFYYEPTNSALMTENETNTKRLYGIPNATPFVKDAFHEAIVGQNDYLCELLQENPEGTKFAPHYRLRMAPQSARTICLRLTKEAKTKPFGKEFQQVFVERIREADDFYTKLAPPSASAEQQAIQRQALAGLLWSKQYYHYDIPRWLAGDSGHFPPPPERAFGRNSNWEHLNNEDVLSMPDKWEYPWYASWDLAFHCIPMTMLDPVFAKNQLILLMREWYMSPQGQIPAYEWNFSSVNPPVHAWAALAVYRIESALYSNKDVQFLKRVFQKLLINFTWWANRQDAEENNVFTGGFLGLDNIGVIDRGDLPEQVMLEQADATAWMGMYALNMMDIALEITRHDPTFEDVATKFYEQFMLIGESLNKELWNKEDQFFYDLLHPRQSSAQVLKVRSAVGLSVLFAVSVIKWESCQPLSDFLKRMKFFRNYHRELGRPMPEQLVNEEGDILLSLISREQLVKLLEVLLDEDEFLSPGGIRALSKYHKEHPYCVQIDGQQHSIHYVPGAAETDMFGGNSNWRGPVWMPINYLLIRALKKYHLFFGDDFTVEFPSRSGNRLTLEGVASALSKRLIGIFERDTEGNRRVHGSFNSFYTRPENAHLLLFYEYFNGDTAEGVGASHQTGWTAIVAELIGNDKWKWT